MAGTHGACGGEPGGPGDQGRGTRRPVVTGGRGPGTLGVRELGSQGVRGWGYVRAGGAGALG